MATPNQRLIIQTPAQMIKDPTDLTLTDGLYGGTLIGLVGEIAVRVTVAEKEVMAREYGGRVVEVFRGATDIRIEAALRSWDADAIGLLAPGVTTSTATGFPVMSFPASTHALGTDRAAGILIAPLNTEESPALMLYNSIVSPSSDARVQYAASREGRLPIQCRALPKDASGAKVAEWGLLIDLTTP
jgi:hypothetical protein